MKPPTLKQAVKDTFKRIYSGNNKKMLDNLGKLDAKGSRSFGSVSAPTTNRTATLKEKPAKPAFPQKGLAPISTPPITVGSLFSGIGGIELGLERTGGFKTIWYCEIDLYASAVLKKHWPDVPNLGDITKVDWNGVEKPNMLCGGFPCQDISVAGKGKGIEGGHRSGLWFEYAKAIGNLRPRIALIENVPAIVGRGLDIVLADLAEMRYDAEWFNLSASDVGAWHMRERIFIIAYSHSVGNSQLPDGGEGGNAPNTNSSRCEERRKPEPAEKKQPSSEYISQNIPNSKSKRLDGGICGNNKDGGRRILKREEGERASLRGEVAGRHKVRNQQAYWKAEPDVGRVADGIPSRVDRIKCLGNAVVPQVAEAIGEMILEGLNDR